MPNDPSLLNSAELWLGLIALAAVVTWIVERVHASWRTFDVGLSLKLDRTPRSATTDALGIVILLQNDSSDSIRLQHVALRARLPNQPDAGLIDVSDERLWRRVRDGRMVWERYDSSYGRIVLGPGESTRLERLLEIPARAPVTVELEAQGIRLLWARDFRWRGAAVSLPDEGRSPSTRRPLAA